MSARIQPIPLDYKTPGEEPTCADTPPARDSSVACRSGPHAADHPRDVPNRETSSVRVGRCRVRRSPNGSTGTIWRHGWLSHCGSRNGPRLRNTFDLGIRRLQWDWAPGSDGCRYDDDDVSTRSLWLRAHPARPLTRDAVRDYISRGGFDLTTSEGQTVADAILTELQNLSTGVLPPILTGQPYAGQVPAVRYEMAGTHLVNLGEYGYLVWLPWYWPFCLPVWLLASTLIGRAMFRRYHRRLAEAVCAARTLRGQPPIWPMETVSVNSEDDPRPSVVGAGPAVYEQAVVKCERAEFEGVESNRLFGVTAPACRQTPLLILLG